MIAPDFIAWNSRRLISMWIRRRGYGVLVLGLAAVLLIGAAYAYRAATISHAREIEKLANAGQPLLMGEGVAPQETVSKAIAGFYSGLPTEEDLPQALADVFNAAEKNRIVLDKGDYKLDEDTKSQLLRYRISLPVKGDSLAIQQFISDALVSQRYLTFESIQIKRDRSDSRSVEARIQWTLLVRPQRSPSEAGIR